MLKKKTPNKITFIKKRKFVNVSKVKDKAIFFYLELSFMTGYFLKYTVQERNNLYSTTRTEQEHFCILITLVCYKTFPKIV